MSTEPVSPPRDSDTQDQETEAWLHAESEKWRERATKAEDALAECVRELDTATKTMQEAAGRAEEMRTQQERAEKAEERADDAEHIATEACSVLGVKVNLRASDACARAVVESICGLKARAEVACRCGPAG